jgi:hypothetical protein
MNAVLVLLCRQGSREAVGTNEVLSSVAVAACLRLTKGSHGRKRISHREDIMGAVAGAAARRIGIAGGERLSVDSGLKCARDVAVA